MALICAISNEVPEAPVISPVSGSVFEKRLIEKYIQENGEKDPINHEPLSADMLIDIKVPPFVKAKPPTATSIPAILKSLQDEWDAVMLHSFTLRQQLQTARQELSHALYQHDAACRVIARLTKEVTSAREALATLKPHQPTSYVPGAAAQASYNEVSQSTAVDVVGISLSVQKKLQETATVLSAERKRRGKQVPEDLRTGEQISNFRVLQSHPGLHSASAPGIACLDMAGNHIVTGGNDKTIAVFNMETQNIVKSLKGHNKKVVAVAMHPDQRTVISGSMDSTVRVWNVDNSHSLRVIQAHDSHVTGLSLHATGDYILSSSYDCSWAFSDVETGAILAKISPEDSPPLTSAKFHPDGLIFGTGTERADVKIWDLKEQQNVADFPGHTGSVIAMAFSENGYYLATASEDDTVRLWDLRKLKNFKTLTMDDKHGVTDLAFDQSGSYLSVIGNDLRIYNSRSWNQVALFAEHTQLGTGVRFGPSASLIVSSSLDRTIKIYGSV